MRTAAPTLFVISLAGLVLASCRAKPVEEPSSSTTRRPGGSDRDQAVGEQIVQVATGAESTCVRTRSGRVACIGERMAYSESEAGIDTSLPQVVDVPPSKDISAGVGFACSVDRDGGKVRCFGSNEWGQLGRITPGKSDFWALPVPDLVGVDSVSSLAEVTCARHGRLATCWPGSKKGDYIRFELSEAADPELEVRFEPVAHDAEEEDFDFDDEASAHLFYGGHGFSRTPSYMSDGLGDSDSHRPWQANFGSRFGDEAWCGRSGESIRCGRGEEFLPLPNARVGLDHACAPVDQGVRCGGGNIAGQAPTEDVVLGGRPKSLAVGAEHSCAVTDAGSVLCWGASGRGQIGLVPAQGRPARIVARDVERAWALVGRTCYTTTSGELSCTGDDEDACASPAFAPVPRIGGATQVFHGPEGELCASVADGELWCEDDEQWTRTISVKGFGGSTPRWDFTAIWLSDTPTTRERLGLCWIENGRPLCAPWLIERREVYGPEGRLPTPPIDPDQALGARETPFGARERFVRLESIDGRLCGLTADGALRCVNRGSRGSEAPGSPVWTEVEHDLPPGRVTGLGPQAAVMADGAPFFLSATDRNERIQVWRIGPRNSNPSVVAASNGCLLDRAHRITCEGEVSGFAQDTPFESLTTSRSLLPSWGHACAVDAAHNLWCWGDGGSGQLGDGQPICSKTPRDLSASFYKAFAATP